MDFIAAIVLILLISPILVLLTIWMFIYYKGNPFFTQKRPGKNNRVFKVVKFKSMVDIFDEKGNPLPNKDRITNVGRFLRKTSLDELPQLFNVLIGDMSFVGPRPLFVEYLDYYTDRELLRHTVKPGITGLAQVNGRNALEWDKRLELDVHYVENLTFLMDINIVLKTINKIITSSDVTVIPRMPLLNKIRNKQR